MIGTITVNGMVLSAMPMGEYDKRLTILTVERGKISAFARGARKPNSSLLACSQPFSYGEFTVYAGRDSYTVSSAQIENYFPGLRADPARVYLGMYFCEFADYFTREGNDEREVLRLLYQSLRALESEKFPAALVRGGFELKLIAIEGEAPQVFECVRCRRARAQERSGQNHENDALTHFFMGRDGMVCGKCAAELTAAAAVEESRTDCRPVSAACLYAMQYVVGTPCAQLYRFTLKDEVLQEFGALVKQYIKRHVEHEMKALQVLEAMGLE
ncbi:MAG: DNA repair protein RecO [Lachnospiraceae bacterium]|nr:DNA repair protein RecO [Lachnospiraceae bacterium]